MTLTCYIADAEKDADMKNLDPQEERMEKVMDDLISRQAAIEAILHNQEVYSNNFGDDPIDKYTIAIIDNDAQTIAQLPSAEPRKGKWIKEYWNGEHTRKCSACNITQTVTTYKGKVNFNYCPYCGAKMEENDGK